MAYAQLPPSACAQLAVDQPVEERVLRSQAHRHPLAVRRPRPGDRDVGGAVEDLAPPVGGGPLGGAVEDLLEHARHGQDEGRLELAEVGHQVLDVGAVAHLGPALDAADLDDAREDVGERQEQQGRGVVGVEELGQLVDGDAELEHEVAVGEHAALGLAGRAAGVDQRGDVLRGCRRTTLLEHVVGDVGAEAAEHVDRVVLERPHVLQLGEVAGLAGLADPGEVVRALRHDRAGARVLEDPADLLGGGRLVDRHGDGAGEPDGVVEERPLVAGLGEERDAVADLDARGDQPLGDGLHLVEELGGGDVGPLVAGTPAEHHGVGEVAAVGDHVVGEVPGGRDGDAERRRELPHDGTS